MEKRGSEPGKMSERNEKKVEEKEEEIAGKTGLGNRNMKAGDRERTGE